MSSVIGSITVLDGRSVKWEICPPLRQGLYESGNFALAIGSCRFVIEKDHFKCKLYLAISQWSTFQSLLLSIQKRHEVFETQRFYNRDLIDWILPVPADQKGQQVRGPSMKVEDPHLMTSDDGIPISIHCVLEMDSVGGAEESPNKGSAVGGKKIVTHEDKGTTKLIKDLEEILCSGKDSDAVLNVQNREFKVHRLILGMRSPVFSAMFENEMEEKKSGVVNIEDCDPETFPDFLHYMYTGAVEKLTSKNAFQLYWAAEKYQLQELKEECLEYMKINVSVENFCDVMSLSLLHQEEELTRIATQFFKENVDDIIETSKWATFYNENRTAGNELIVKLTKCVGKRNK